MNFPRLFLLALCVCLATGGYAQCIMPDSVKISPANKHKHSLNATEIIVPAAVIGLSAFSVHNNWLARQREHIQDVLSAKGEHHFKADEYLRFSQMAAVYALDAFGVKGKHNFKDKTIILAMSAATMGIAVKSMKLAFKEDRPDGDGNDAFPSGHTATAFMGAEFLYQEYKDVSPWIGYSGYALAALTGYLRIYNNRHYLNDVLAGAAIGVLSTKFAYWLYPRIFSKSACNAGSSVRFAAMPYYSHDGLGANLVVHF